MGTRPSPRATSAPSTRPSPSRSPPPAATLRPYATANVTATQPADYTQTNSTLTFTPPRPARPSTSRSRATRPRAQRRFHGRALERIEHTISTPLGRRHDHRRRPPPSASINDIAVDEGNTGTTDAPFTVTLSAPSGRRSRSTTRRPARAPRSPSDYTHGPPHADDRSRRARGTIHVPINGDTLDEADETIRRQPVERRDTTISDTQGVGTITNDDTTVDGRS